MERLKRFLRNSAGQFGAMTTETFRDGRAGAMGKAMRFYTGCALPAHQACML
jgi:hypothetical protein